MDFLPRVKVKNSSPCGLRPRGEEFLFLLSLLIDLQEKNFVSTPGGIVKNVRMYCSYPTGRERMKFSPHVKVKNSSPRGRRPQGEEFFTFTRGENFILSHPVG